MLRACEACPEGFKLNLVGFFQSSSNLDVSDGKFPLSQLTYHFDAWLETTVHQSTIDYMELKKLPSGSAIPALGFGTYQLSGKECVDAVIEALKAGYRHIDTAEIYRNEKEIAKALKISGIPRAEIFITSKIAPQSQGFEAAKAACVKTLKALEV